MLDQSEQRELVDRILGSKLFHKSGRLSTFLKFVCEQHWKGRADTINEQRIGTVVFQRAPGYHVGDDSIVRSQARFLRQRLEEYFNTAGAHETLLLTIPKGSYLPTFERRQSQPAIPLSTDPTLSARCAAGLAAISRGRKNCLSLAFPCCTRRSRVFLEAEHADGGADGGRSFGQPFLVVDLRSPTAGFDCSSGQQPCADGRIERALRRPVLLP
jgi:hypothetical protein